MSPPKTATEIQVASDESENSSDVVSVYDSLYDSEDASITDTLRSKWKENCHKFVHGRRYANTGKFSDSILPNDEQSQDQLDLSHQICTYVMTINEDKEWDPASGDPPMLHLSPIGDNPQKVLDVGTGTGIWAMEFGDRYPSAEVIGADISPIQPEWVPPNVLFEVEDATTNWARSANSFDFVYARSMHATFSDWPSVCRNAFRVLKPGGYFEVYSEIAKICSDDNTMPEDWLFPQWMAKVRNQLAEWGIKMCIDEYIQEDMEAAGFTDIKKVTYKVPIGPWAKDPKLKNLGAMFLVNLFQGLEGWSLVIFTQGLKWSLEDTQKYLASVKKSLYNKKIHAYLPFSCWSGKKPLPAGKATTSEHVVRDTAPAEETK